MTESGRSRPQVIRPRVRLGDSVLIGPGKIELLRAVAEHGSISAAARALGMGYKRAWSLLDELQRACPVPILETAAGGSRAAVRRSQLLGMRCWRTTTNWSRPVAWRPSPP